MLYVYKMYKAIFQNLLYKDYYDSDSIAFEDDSSRIIIIYGVLFYVPKFMLKSPTELVANIFTSTNNCCGGTFVKVVIIADLIDDLHINGLVYIKAENISKKLTCKEIFACDLSVLKLSANICAETLHINYSMLNYIVESEIEFTHIINIMYYGPRLDECDAIIDLFPSINLLRTLNADIFADQLLIVNNLCKDFIAA